MQATHMSTIQAGATGAAGEQALSFRDLLRIVRERWVMLLVAAVAGAAAAAIVAFSLRPVYRAEVVLSPSEGQGAAGALGQLMGGLGSLGTLAGLNLGGGASLRNEYIAVLKSRALTEEFVESGKLLPVLYADDWDESRTAWTTDDPPTLAGAVEDFNEDVRSVNEDRRTGLVTLRIEWYDRKLAADWANRYVALANDTARRRVIQESNSTLRYLNAELEKTDVVGVQEAIYSLIEAQINQIAVANVQQEYAFRIVDPAVPAEPDRFVRPLRPLIVALGAIVALGLGFLWALLGDARRRGEANVG